MKSYPYFKKEIASYLIDRFSRDSSVLDVGAGDGVYYDLIGDYFRNIDAVEIYMPNIKKYKLEWKYRTVYNTDIREFKYEQYDIIIFGDVLEHLEVEEARKVLEYALKRCREVVVAVPYCYKQGEIEGNRYEIHKQDDLTEEKMLERYPYLKLLYGNEEYGYYIKR